jgi:hypothetical protein
MAVADHGVVFNGRGQKFLSAKLESDSLGLVLEAPLPSKRGGNFLQGMAKSMRDQPWFSRHSLTEIRRSTRRSERPVHSGFAPIDTILVHALTCLFGAQISG